MLNRQRKSETERNGRRGACSSAASYPRMPRNKVCGSRITQLKKPHQERRSGMIGFPLAGDLDLFLGLSCDPSKHFITGMVSLPNVAAEVHRILAMGKAMQTLDKRLLRVQSAKSNLM